MGDSSGSVFKLLRSDLSLRLVPNPLRVRYYDDADDDADDDDDDDVDGGDDDDDHHHHHHDHDHDDDDDGDGHGDDDDDDDDDDRSRVSFPFSLLVAVSGWRGSDRRDEPCRFVAASSHYACISHWSLDTTSQVFPIRLS